MNILLKAFIVQTYISIFVILIQDLHIIQLFLAPGWSFRVGLSVECTGGLTGKTVDDDDFPTACLKKLNRNNIFNV